MNGKDYENTVLEALDNLEEIRESAFIELIGMFHRYKNGKMTEKSFDILMDMKSECHFLLETMEIF